MNKSLDTANITMQAMNDLMKELHDEIYKELQIPFLDGTKTFFRVQNVFKIWQDIVENHVK